VNIKSYTRRDSATAALRKMGVDKSQYDQFIHHSVSETSDTYAFDYDEVLLALKTAQTPEDVVEVSEEPTKKPPRVAKKNQPSQKQKAPAAKKSTRPPGRPVASGDSLSAVCRDLLAEGKTNPEIWNIIQPKFALDEKKKYYPAWFRWKSIHGEKPKKKER